MKSTRQRILDYLKEHQVSTAAELSRILNLTPADVRHHLGVLNRQGSIISIGHRLTHQKGRPSNLYALTDRIARNNFHLLTHLILGELLNNIPSNEYHRFLKLIGSSLASGARLGLPNFTRRIYLATKYLTELNYDASWEAHSLSPRLILGHCPYTRIIDQHPEICLIDAYLLESLIGQPVQQIEKLTPSTHELPHCVFTLKIYPSLS